MIHKIKIDIKIVIQKYITILIMYFKDKFMNYTDFLRKVGNIGNNIYYYDIYVKLYDLNIYTPLNYNDFLRKVGNIGYNISYYELYKNTI